MRRLGGGYWVVWRTVTGACLVLGVGLTAVLDPLVTLILMAIMATGAACLLAAVVKHADRSSRFVLRTAPLVFLVLAGVNGLGEALGGATVALVAALIITGIPVVWQAWRRPEAAEQRPAPQPKPRKAKPAKKIEPVQEVEKTEQVEEIDEPPATTASLCWTWRTSFTALHKADGVDERLRIVELRQRCLDELARREPAGFRKWLADGARAAGDPTRYVCARQHQPPEHPQGG